MHLCVKTQIGGWKQQLFGKHKELFKKVAVKLVRVLGYTTNDAW
jgi:hypothetical protein